MLFIHCSSAFNTFIPMRLVVKMSLLGMITSLCIWILDFLTKRPEYTSRSIKLNTGVPQGSVLRPLLFTLLTHDCAAQHSSNHTITFMDVTTVVAVIRMRLRTEPRTIN